MKLTQLLKIKPLSVNKAWKGKRFKTNKYRRYQNDVLFLLWPFTIPKTELCLKVTWGFSSSNADIDNPLKPFIDCLQKKYGFNDRDIKRLVVDIEKVKKGDEFIRFSLESL